MTNPDVVGARLLDDDDSDLMHIAALDSDRPYKKTWTEEAMVDLIRENSGKHFEPSLVAILLCELPRIVAIRDQFSESGIQ